MSMLAVNISFAQPKPLSPQDKKIMTFYVSNVSMYLKHLKKNFDTIKDKYETMDLAKLREALRKDKRRVLFLFYNAPKMYKIAKKYKFENLMEYKFLVSSTRHMKRYYDRIYRWNHTNIKKHKVVLKYAIQITKSTRYMKKIKKE